MTIPTLEHAQGMLAEAEAMNPGPWVTHSRSVARVAQTVAERCGLDGDVAYVLGLLHDIGRREGFSHIKHTIDGYRYLLAQGFDDAAVVCLTHSFSIPEVSVYQGEVDCAPEEFALIRRFVETRPFTDYDRLIQLCDSLAFSQGPVLLEKRLVDVALRYGTPDFLARKWQAYFGLLRYFEEKIGGSVYALFPDVVENTFGLL